MKTTEQLQNEFWELRVENEQKYSRFQDELFQMEKSYNSKLTKFLSMALGFVGLIAVIIAVIKIV